MKKQIPWNWILFILLVAAILYIGMAAEEEERYLQESACVNLKCKLHDYIRIGVK